MEKKESIVAYGRKPIEEILSTHGTYVSQILLKETLDEKDCVSIIQACKKNKIPFNRVPEKKLELFTGEDVNHQGVVALLKGFPYQEFSLWLDSIRATKRASVLLLDQVQDVHNLGAIIRSAAAFGIDAVIIGEHRQAPVTGAVFKTSAGAVLRIPIIQVGNTNQALDTLKEKGFWSIGLDGAGTIELATYDHDDRLVIVIGSEGYGIREKTKERCDTLVRIPIQGIESLNASVAAAIACYERRKFLKS